MTGRSRGLTVLILLADLVTATATAATADSLEGGPYVTTGDARDGGSTGRVSSHSQAASSGRTDDQGSVTMEPPPGTVQELRLEDGSKLYGRVERIDGDRIVFRTIAGASLEIEREQIARLSVAEGRLIRGEFYPSDSNTTRLLFAPTGRALPKGEGYFGVFEFFLPFVQVGLTDRISVGAGTPLVFGGGTDRPFWVTPKMQVFKKSTTSAAVGLFHITVDQGYAGIAYGVVTHGTPDAAVTVGAGRGYDQAGGTAILMVGGERRATRSIKLITENYFFRGGGLLSGGVRFFGERLSADVGLVVPLVEEPVAFPVVNFVWRF